MTFLSTLIIAHEGLQILTRALHVVPSCNAVQDIAHRHREQNISVIRQSTL